MSHDLRKLRGFVESSSAPLYRLASSTITQLKLVITQYNETRSWLSASKIDPTARCDVPALIFILTDEMLIYVFFGPHNY